MPATDAPKLPLLCDHAGCQSPAVGRYVVGKPKGGFETIVRCQEHAGNATMKEPVNAGGKA